MTMTRRLMLGLSAGLMLAFAQPGLAETPLKVGSYPANPPWETKTAAGGFEGFEVDIANEVAKRLGTTTEFEAMDFKALFVASASRRVDMVISSIAVTDKRLESQSFTQPIVGVELGIGVKDGSAITSVKDLKGKVVGAIATSNPENWMKEHKDEVGYSDLKSYESTATMLTDLLSGRIDAAINDVVGLQYAFTQMKGLKVVDKISTGQKIAIMMPKGSERLEAVNNAISDMKKDGTMAALYKKWLGVEPDAGSYTVTPLPVPTLN